MPSLPGKNRLSAGKINNSLVIAVVLLIAAGAFYYFFPGKTRGIEINLKASENPLLGEAFEITVGFANNSASLIKDLKLSLNLPPGVSFADGKNGLRKTNSLGEVGEGGVRQAFFEVVAFDVGQKKFRLEAAYLPSSLNKGLIVNKDIEVVVGSAIETKIVIPEKVVSGEDFEWSVECQNVSQADRSPKIELIAPKELTTNFKEQTVNLKSGETSQLSFIGNIIFPEENFFDLGLRFKDKFMGRDYLLSEVIGSVSVAPSPLSLKIALASGERTAVKPGEILNYQLIFKNNAETPLRDIVLKASLKGEMYDFSTLNAGKGTFNSSSKVITWNALTNGELKELSPNDSKVIDFSIGVRPDYPIRRLNDKNFTLEIESRIESPTVPYLVKALKTVNIASLSTKVAGNIKLEAKAFFRDASSGILNDGPWPPEVGAATDFTVHWLVYNYSTDTADIIVKAELENGAVFTGKTKVEVGSLEFRNETREVVWRIPRLIATSGVISAPPEAVFQIKATPQPSQRLSFMPLTKETLVSGRDEFSETVLENFDAALTTALLHDPTVKIADGLVK